MEANSTHNSALLASLKRIFLQNTQLSSTAYSRGWTLRGFSLFSALTFLIGLNGWGQASSANYTFATNATGSLASDMNSNSIDMSTGTIELINAGRDAVPSGIRRFPDDFKFWLMGTEFSNFSVTEDGIVQLGNTFAAANNFNLTTGTLTLPKISAFNADLRTGTGGKVHYKIVGTAPNRCLVIEFNTMQLFYNSTTTTAGASTWQVRLYETSGIVEFVYGAMSCDLAAASNNTPSVGFYTGATTNSSYLFVNYATNTASSSSTAANAAITALGVITNLNSSANGSRRVYRLTPSNPSAPSGLNVTSLSSTTCTLNWTDNSNNEANFVVYQSTDNVNYTLVNQPLANATSYSVNGLQPSTKYFWKVFARRENLSSASTDVSATTTSSGATIITYSTFGTYTFVVPAGVCSVNVNAWGAGGAGGNHLGTTARSSAGGGGGGAFAGSTAITVTPGSEVTVTVGRGGIPNVAFGGNGGNGGSSSFNSTTVVAAGGTGGTGGNAGAGGAGGTTASSTGTTKWAGGIGGTGATAAAASLTGAGAGSAGTGANGNFTIATTSGIAATLVTGGVAGVAGVSTGTGNVGTNGLAGGGGGSGSKNANVTASAALNLNLAGTGGDGKVVITWTALSGTSATPVVTSPICESATSVSGTSSEADGTIIEVFSGSNSLGTTTVSSGAWTKSSLTALSSGASITAKANACGKALSAASTAVVVASCSSPLITVSTSSLTAFTACATVASSTATFTISGANLGANNLTVTPPAGFEISSDGGATYVSTTSSPALLTFTPTSGSVSTTTITVRMKALASSPTGANITCTSSLASSQTVSVSGTVTAALSAVAVTANTAQSICSNGTGTQLTAAGTGGGTPTYAWGKRSSSGGVITDLGVSTSTYTPTGAGLGAGTWYVVCTITPQCGSAIVSNEVTVTVTTLPTATALSYTGTPFCSTVTSASPSLTGTTGGTYSSTAGLSITGSTGVIVPSTSTAGTYTVTYTIAAAGGCSVVSTTTSVVINTSPAITTNPTNTSVAAGGNTTLTTAASNTPTSYTWEVYNGTAWSTITGGVYSTVNTATLTINGATFSMNGYLYRVTATNSCGSSSVSSSATLTVNYCTSTGPASQGSDYFTNVTVTASGVGINNTSTFSTNGYGDFTAQSVSQSIGGTVNYSLTSPGVGNGSSFGIFVDWNQDGDFGDANESAFLNPTTGLQPSANPSGTFTVPAGATLGSTRMRIVVKNSSGQVSSCNSAQANSETEDYTFTVTAALPMTYVSSTTTQANVASVNPGSTSQQIIGIEIVTSGTTSPLTASSFTFNTTGSTAAADIANAKLWTTGTSSTFATTTQLGSASLSPSGSFTITGGTNLPYTLATGTNYFWLTYDIAASPTLNNVVDAQCTSITISSAQTPTVSNPTGSRTISVVYCTYSNTNSTSYRINSFSTTNGVANISNLSSGFSTNGYGNFTAQIVSAYIGGTNVSFSIASFNNSSASTALFGVWIDWNGDGDFLDANENQHLTTSGATTTTGSITIPVGTSAGTKRMRVTHDWFLNTPVACTGSNYGECEDYTFTVLTLDCSNITTYYSKSTGNLNLVSSWGSIADGAGCSPANFTTNGITYIIQNNLTPTTSSSEWEVSGIGSIVKVGDGSSATTFTAGGNLKFTCDLEITANATLNLNTRNMILSGDFIRSASSAGFSQTPNSDPSGSTVTFSGSSQNINVTTNNGTNPTDSDITFNHVTISGSDVKLFYFKTNDRKLNINNFTVNSGAVVTLYSNPQ